VTTLADPGVAAEPTGRVGLPRLAEAMLVTGASGRFRRSDAERGVVTLSADFHATSWAQRWRCDASVLPAKLYVNRDALTQEIAADRLTKVHSRGSGPRPECPSCSLFTPVSPTTTAGSPLTPWPAGQAFMLHLQPLGTLPSPSGPRSECQALHQSRSPVASNLLRGNRR